MYAILNSEGLQKKVEFQLALEQVAFKLFLPWSSLLYENTKPCGNLIIMAQSLKPEFSKIRPDKSVQENLVLIGLKNKP